jgi:N-acetylglutamate synthase-like GNAT family acetyltransferase
MLELLPGNRQILTATHGHARFIRDLQNKFCKALGFIPDAATAWYIDHGQVSLALENDDPAGMLLGRDALRWNPAIRPIFQAAIAFDAQRRHHGLTLVERTAADARDAGQMAVQANCAEGLEANEFWRLAGFEAICRMTPRNARKRAIICWRMQLHPTFRPTWFDVAPPVAGHHAKRVKG